ncbi:M15 family metallopeptidase [Undibacterium sp. RuRC25W]|uniref:M15 family metallopeptidase n=1 Tax=Undibacterium sp. RuRC25W TaxID=3413047 RepID=UPI003BEF4D57
MRCELLPEHPDFCRLSSVNGALLDLRYVGAHNFVGRDLYGTLDCAWLHKEAAAALQRAVDTLAHAHPDLRLLVLDALRPHRVQELLWQHLAGTPLQMYVADPVRGSIHSFGMAVDVTLVDIAGREVDMGSHFDEFSERSHPDMEPPLLASGQLLPQHIVHREILRKVMFGAGFQGIHSEWWHFNLGSMETIRQTYVRID